MATPEQIYELRILIAELEDVEPYTDSLLSDRIDALGASPDLRVLAGRVWMEKAAGFTELVDVSEDGSSRRLGSLADNARKMSAFYDAQVAADIPGSSGVRIKRLRR